MARADLVRRELEACGLEYLIWLPDSETRFLYDSVSASPSLRLIQVCRENEAMGVYAGLYAGGKKAAVLIQNCGFFNAIDALRGVVLGFDLPLLLMIGYRGYRNLVEGRPPFDSAAVLTEPILDAMGIKHYLVDRDEEVGRIGLAYREAEATNRPVAVLMGREYD